MRRQPWRPPQPPRPRRPPESPWPSNNPRQPPLKIQKTKKEFPELINPVQMNFDTRGRLWVSAWPTYPETTPTTTNFDKLIVFDIDPKDGKFTKCTTFADGLNCPTGFQLYKDGVIVMQSPWRSGGRTGSECTLRRFRVGSRRARGCCSVTVLRRAAGESPATCDQSFSSTFNVNLPLEVLLLVSDRARRPVRWACAQPINADGSLMIQLIRSDDKRWRKGV